MFMYCLKCWIGGFIFQSKSDGWDYFFGVDLPLTVDDWSEHCHTFVVWIAHCLIQNQATNTGKKTTYSMRVWVGSKSLILKLCGFISKKQKNSFVFEDIWSSGDKAVGPSGRDSVTAGLTCWWTWLKWQDASQTLGPLWLVESDVQ